MWTLIADAFRERRVLLGVTGGIAAYKAASLASRLVQCGAEVQVVMTAHAQEFIAPLTFQTLSGRPVWSDLFTRPEAYGMRHLAGKDWGEVLLVAPATANFLGKAAHGIADDLLSTLYLAFPGPVVVAPAMHESMWRHPAVQANVEELGRRGVFLVPPEEGRLASGQVGVGRLAQEEVIATALACALQQGKDFAGLKVVVTAGPTREWMDPVRFISNPSSGRMGFALAVAARSRGAQVTLVSGPSSLPDPWGVETLRVETAAEMWEAVRARAEGMDVFIGSAAVADFAPAEREAQKVKKEGREEWLLRLRPTVDILQELARLGAGRLRVGFAAETQRVQEGARRKLEAKGLDLIVANDIRRSDAGFGTDTNVATLLDRWGQVEELPLMSKYRLAHRILDRVRDLLAKEA